MPAIYDGAAATTEARRLIDAAGPIWSQCSLEDDLFSFALAMVTRLEDEMEKLRTRTDDELADRELVAEGVDLRVKC